MKNREIGKRLKQYASKRNVVFKKGGWVYKCHSDSVAAKREAQFLRLLSGNGVRVPQLRHCVGCVLVLRAVPGLPLPDLLCSAEVRFDIDAVAQGIVNWLQVFYAAVDHSATGENRGDVNGRNFLVDGQTVWGLDFEEHSFGTREEDIGRLAAFIESYDNSDGRLAKRLSSAVMNHGIAQMGLDAALVENERQREFAAMARRRKRSAASSGKG